MKDAIIAAAAVIGFDALTALVGLLAFNLHPGGHYGQNAGALDFLFAVMLFIAAPLTLVATMATFYEAIDAIRRKG